MNAAKSKTTIRDKDNMETETNGNPPPDDFGLYVPWAYNQLQGDMKLVIMKTMQNEYINIGRATDHSKPKAKRSKVVPSTTSENDNASLSWRPNVQLPTEKVVRIITTYDYDNKLVHIKFDKNIEIPRKLMKIIGLIMQFHTYLTAVTINRGLDKYTVHELNSWLPISSITDLCLDDTFVEEANYHILLETTSCLKNLSVARCKIDDNVIKNIASKLVHPFQASKNLALLNLASNRISDLGATYLGEALRSNRKLYYLNLADNMITDDGAINIFNILIEFPLSTGEMLAMRSEFMFYLKRKNNLSEKILGDLKAGEYDKRVARKKSIKATQTVVKKVKGVERDQSARNLIENTTKSLLSIETALREKAEILAENMLGKFDATFSSTNTITKEGITYCLGNNILCYLNLAYNNLSYISVRKLLKVVATQKTLDRRPRGLVNVCIEGNNIPVQCIELINIDDILEMGLISQKGRLSTAKRKPTPRGSGK